MSVEVILIAAGAFVISVVLTGVVRRQALKRGLMDMPNQRSSHSIPTPRGGGIAIVVAYLLAAVALGLSSNVDTRLVIALVGGGAAVALVGFADDRSAVRASVRLIVHFAAAIWALGWLGGLPPLQLGARVIDLGWAGYLLGSVGIVWTLNLFNFMDGIDGLAASEATFVGWGAALLAILAGGAGDTTQTGLILGAASCGFLLWNVSPARIFMGDVGSGFLGFCVAVSALAAARSNAVALLVWLILGGVFFVDATLTMARRLARGERVYEAHRSHAYQWLARRWNSHHRVTLIVLAVNVCWLLPFGAVALIRPERAASTVLIALVPVAIIAAMAGAGRSEREPPHTS